ncbi:ribulose-phosphate 3-epimerase [Oxobacter pfennigii]|uniref:Ribulose-phosphate 3-epimerase n=1 Tax=Oxobacter pfennigii TaxID=36849 RepID=A0A0P8W7D5_9CLOT|nr:ribulose-phosphate 3-epimerase [Oxobacter pfennigii]KPU43971.1 ribulose-phosphate 3-epimerase [Oxobacter pfennigii]
MIRVAPSILAADFSNLAQDIKNVEEAGADLLHLDIMDGHFVPNISIGPPVVAALRDKTKLPFDVHLMITQPDKYIDSFVKAGADIITVHAEACTHLNRTIYSIKQHGIKAAVALNPATSLTVLDYILEDIDMVLLMTVNPGFGGQSYIKSMTRKIRSLKNMLDERKLIVDIQVDGGINTENIKEIIDAGANVIVAGSAVYKSKDIRATINSLRMMG